MSARASSCAPKCRTDTLTASASAAVVNENFYQRPQAGLWPRLPRPVLRDHHAARRRDGRGRDADAAEAGTGGRNNPARRRALRRRTVFDDGKALETPRYRRDKLLADDQISGPALIVQHNSTTLVPPGYVADRHGLWRHAGQPELRERDWHDSKSIPSPCKSSAARCIRSPSRWATCSTA